MALAIRKKKTTASAIAQSGPGFGNVPGTGPVGFAQLAPISPAAAAAAAQPQSSPAPPTFTFTPDAAYEDQVKAYEKERDNARTGYVADAARILRDFGYQGTAGDPYGTNFQLDPSNPYSKAQQLERSYAQAKTGATNSYAARGQLYSGSLQNAKNTAQYNYDSSKNTLSTALADALSRLRGADKELDVSFDKAKAGALAEAISRAGQTTPVPDPQPQAAQAAPPTNPWIARGLKGPNGETLNVDNRGTWYRRKSDNQVIWVKRNK